MRTTMNESSIFRAFIGTEFTAKDKLGRVFRYKALGYNPHDLSREFKLRNLDDGTMTEVEREWFNQRKIEII